MLMGESGSSRRAFASARPSGFSSWTLAPGLNVMASGRAEVRPSVKPFTRTANGTRTVSTPFAETSSAPR